MRKVHERIQKLNSKDISDILDLNSLTRLSYQLSIINASKKMDWTVRMINKGFIPYTANIFLMKQHHHSAKNYTILTQLMIFFSEMVKLSKVADKGSPLFNTSFLLDFIHPTTSVSPEYVLYLLKCFTFLKELSVNKEFLASSRVNAGVTMECKQIDSILEILLLSSCKEKVSNVLVEYVKNVGKDHALLQVVNNLLKS